MQNKVDTDHSSRRCNALIRSHHVMTLATASERGAWSTPVYYYYADHHFFFFSSRNSRHIKEAGEEIKSAVSIFHDPGDSFVTGFEQIQGVQMSGTIKSGTGHPRALQTTIAYIRKFGLNIKGPDPLDVIQSAFHASLYCFVPDRVFFIDNSKGLGNRQEVKL